MKLKKLLKKGAVYLCTIGMLVTTIGPAPMSVSAQTLGTRLASKDFLSVEQGRLKTRDGQEVVLKGFNFGGWMVQESWMCSVNGADRAWANLDSIKAMESNGLTADQILEAFNTYQDNFITEEDFENIKNMGLNCIRIPFWYRNFMKDEQGTWWNAGNLNENPGFKRLDWAIEQASKRGMYVILDLHGAPGGQSMDHSTGTLGKNDLYGSTANRAIMQDLWEKIAARYKENPAVAAYDIMNEPQNNNGYSGANSWTPGSAEATTRTNAVYDQMIKAIRKVDPNHVITVEAIWEMAALPNPNEFGWTNMMYQMHLYDKTKEKIDQRVQELLDARENYGVAIYVGEFNNDDTGEKKQDYAYQRYCNNDISWTIWTYKTAKNQGNWSLYQTNAPVVDTRTDSFETIKQKWGSNLRTTNFTKNDVMGTWISTYANYQGEGEQDSTFYEKGWTRYEAENALIVNYNKAENEKGGNGDGTESHDFYSNGKAAAHLNTNVTFENIKADWSNIAYVDFKVNVDEDGIYKMKIGYNGDDSKSIVVRANNGVNQLVDLPELDGKQWDKLHYKIVDIELKAGENRVQVSGTIINKSVWANIDFIDIKDGKQTGGGTGENEGDGDLVGRAVEVVYTSEYKPKDHAWIKDDLGSNLKYKLSKQESLVIEPADNTNPGKVINVNRDETYQTMRGIGTSLDGTSAANLWALSKTARTAVLKQWFDPENGCGYDWVRLCCGTSDFSSVDWYTYDDVAGDTELEHFSIQKDIDLHIIEIAQEIIAINPDVTFLMSPWSPPKWMKDNNSFTNGGKLLEKYYDVCAKLYAKAVTAYKGYGINITEFTTNNETRFGPGAYPGCVFTVDEEVKFATSLKQAFKDSGLSTKVLVLDHNPQYANEAIQELGKDTKNAIDGVAFHDYGGDLSEMSKVVKAYPKTELYFTERSVWGMEGANRIIQYMRNYCNSYQSWVSICDTNQEPNVGPYKGSQFDPPIAIRQAGSDSKYWFNPETYIIGQFAKFFDYGAVRIASDYGEDNGVSTLAVKNPDNSLAIVAVNRNSSAKTVKFAIKGGNQFTSTIPANTMATYKVSDVEASQAPVITPGTKEFASETTVDVTITCPAAGAQIRYTTDGSTPTAASSLYTGGFKVSVSGEGKTTVRARSFEQDKAGSSVVTAVYSVLSSARPTFSLASGKYYSEQIVTIACATEGADIYYSVNGGSERKYTGPITVSETSTIVAYSKKVGMGVSDKGAAVYTFGKRPVWYNDFEDGLGFEAGSSSAVTTSSESRQQTSGYHSVQLRANGSGDPGDSARCVKVSPQSGTIFDATGYSYMIFYLKDTQGSNASFKATFIDENGSKWNEWVDIPSRKNEWVKIAMPLSMVNNINLAKIKEIRIGEYNEGIYYIDDMYFTEGAGDLDPMLTYLREAYDLYKGIEKGNYTDATWSDFDMARKAVEELLKVGNPTQSEISETVSALEKTFEALKFNEADKSELQNLYNKFKDIKKGNYTEKTWKAFETALLSIESILSSNDASQTAVNAGCETLQKAKDGLEELVSTIKLNKSTAILIAKNSIQLEGTVTTQDSTSKAVNWKSSDPKIAIVDSKGKVTALKAGTVKITAIATNGSGKQAVCAITVYEKTSGIKVTANGLATNQKINKKIYIVKGKKGKLTAAVAPAKAQQGVTYETSNKSVVTVSLNGTIKTQKAGKAKIVITSKDKTKKYTVNIVVVKKPKKVKGVKVTSKKNLKLALKQNSQIKTKVASKQTTDRVTYKSSNKKVVTVSSTGVLTAKKTGKATITVKCGKYIRKIKVKVNKK